MTHSQDIIAYLRKRLLPLSIIFGLLCALVPPVLFGATSTQQVRARTEVYAQNLALAIEQDALRNPYIWPYRVNKIISAKKAPTSNRDVLTIHIENCANKTLYHTETTQHRWPAATHRVPIQRGPKQLGHLTMRVSAPALWRVIVLLGVLSTVIGAILGWLLYTLPMTIITRQSKKLAQVNQSLMETQHLLQQNNERLTQEVEQAVSDIQKLSMRQLNVQDQERARIARELHDGLGQMISALGLDIERMAVANPQDKHNAQQLSAQILDELRAIINDLRPVVLQAHGVAQVLRDASEQFELKHRIAVYFKHVGATHCPQEYAVALYRIFQESMNNIQKHAQATEVSVQLTIEPHHIELSIGDDGQGFDPTQQTTGHGFLNLRERVALLRGTFDLQTSDEGTTLTATFHPTEDNPQPTQA